LFKFGCWATIGTALLHLVGHLAGPSQPSNDAERQLLDLATNYHYVLPGGSERSMMDLVNGFSLIFALMLAAVGGVGLIVQKRARHDPTLMWALARMLAITSVVMLGISLTNFFIIPTLCFAVMAVCFVVSSVKAPESGSD